MAKKASAPPSTAKMLRDYRDRIARLEEEKKALGADVKEIYVEAKQNGFDVRALRRVVKETMMDQTQRAAARETEAISDLYRATLGMLDGTPLGDAARRRYEEEARREQGDEERKDAASDGGTEASQEPPQPDADEEAQHAEAREQGRADHAAGKTILENPFSASDFRRAAWDEGWCDADGSDGMDPPDAWRRRAPPSDQPGREA